MTQENIRVLVVDDSAVIRTLLCDQIGSTPGLTVAGKARHGRDALDKVASLHPDVITLDIQMPEMDGLAVLKAILETQPTPVIMVSSLTQAGAAITLEALDLGAADYVAKPEKDIKGSQAFVSELIEKIRNAASMDILRIVATRKRRRVFKERQVQPISKPLLSECPTDLSNKCVALGISTGGPPALTRLLGQIICA